MKIYNEKILLVESDYPTRQIIVTRLKILGYKVFVAGDGQSALLSFKKEVPDLVILDVVLSKLDGYEVCRKIRAISQVPIILLTVIGRLSDRLTALELGADDYIVKPLSPKELEAKINIFLKKFNTRTQTIPKKKWEILYIGDLIVDTKKKQILKDSVELNLTVIEFSILEFFLKNPGKELSRMTILDNIWGYTPERIVDTRIIDVNISRLRSKIESDLTNPALILTIRGTGYMFKAP